jgi:hypothetical protein
MNRFFPPLFPSLCESDDNHDILKKLIKYINSDINVINKEKEFKKLKNVLKMGCTDTLERFINENQPLIKPNPPVRTLPNPLPINKTQEFNIDRLNKQIVGLKYLNDVGKDKLTYYQFFEKNNLLLDKYENWYFKLTGIQNDYDNGNQYAKEKLECIKVIKLEINKEGKFSLINKYNTNNDYRELGESLDKYPFYLYAGVAQGGSYYDKIKILTIETDTKITLDNKNIDNPPLPQLPTQLSQDKNGLTSTNEIVKSLREIIRERERREREEEIRREEEERKKQEDATGLYKKKINIPNNLTPGSFTFNELFRIHGLFNREFNGKTVELYIKEKMIERGGFTSGYREAIFSLKIKIKDNGTYEISDDNDFIVNDAVDTGNFFSSKIEVEVFDEFRFRDKVLSEAYDRYNPKPSSGGKRKSKGKSNKVAKKPAVSQKKQSVYKEIFGKKMKIYKMPDSRKEYVRYKGELHPISEYKSLMKQKALVKPKPKAKK